MRDAGNVITSAVNGHTADLAAMFEVSEPRMYQLLSTHCSYPRTKRLIRAIADVNPDGCRLIKADLDAMFADILGESADVTDAELHKESSEAVQSVLEGKSTADQAKEIRENIAVWSRKLQALTEPKADHTEANQRHASRSVSQFNRRAR